MDLKIQNIGNSKGVIIPSTILKLMGINKAGTDIYFDYDGEKITIAAKNNKKQKQKGA